QDVVLALEETIKLGLEFVDIYWVDIK
ncbi:uncharacterized protein METZ01_LOCUS440613, partial [marine metagenome]